MDEHESTPAVTRRQALKAGAGAVAGGATLTATGAASAQSDAYGGHLSEAEWDGTTVDGTAMDDVIVEVGAGQSGFQFGIPALYVEPGTTVTWMWTGQGGGHNVVNDVEESVFDSRTESEASLISEEGYTYEFTFEESHTGVHPYICVPHEALGMLGVIVVGEDNVETELVTPSTGGGLDKGAIAAGGAVFSTVSLLGVAAYRELTGGDYE
jgi:halocyanin-like protein